jgi:hypothetical protein
MEDKLAVARRWVELYNERSDVAEFVSLLDPEVELQTPGGPRLHGHDQAREWFEREPRCRRWRALDRLLGGSIAGRGHRSTHYGGLPAPDGESVNPCFQPSPRSGLGAGSGRTGV